MLAHSINRTPLCYRSDNVTRLPQKLCISTAVLYWLNVQNEMAHGLQPCDLKTAVPVTPHVGNLSSKFECCMLFSFRVNSGHGTNRQTGWV